MNKLTKGRYKLYTPLTKAQECQECKGKMKGKGKKYCSQACYWRSLKGLKNEKAPNWRGDNIHMVTVHDWLNNNYGKPKMCEGEKCRENSNNYDWCLKKGLKHERKRNNYLRMCKSCHRRYDITEEELKRFLSVNYKTQKYA